MRIKAALFSLVPAVCLAGLVGWGEARLAGMGHGPGRAEAAGPAAVLTHTLYLPQVVRSPAGLHGRVTEAGQPAGGVPLSLIRVYARPLFTEWITATVTRADGLYQFESVPGLASCPADPYCMSAYYVRYADPGPPGAHLLEWRSLPITTYVAGSSLRLPAFDIGAPALLAPAPGATVTPTVTFRWQARPGAADDYRVFMSGSAFYESAWLGPVSQHMLHLPDEVCQEPACADWYGRPLQWGLLIRSQAGEGHVRASGVFTIAP